MGGDRGLDVTVPAAAEVSLEVECEIVLVGDERDLRDRLAQHRHDAKRIRIEPSEGAIGMGASPREALAAQPRASLPVAARLVARGSAVGGADALVSAGNTGAVILACAESFSRMEGVSRSALAAVVPTERRRGEKEDPFSLLLDCGATVRVRARDLVTFALMGASYAAIISKNPRPRVALLSNGSEPSKGTEEIVEAHKILSGLRSIDFIGNVEGVDIPRGTADVVVCDGFTGNVVLKMLEGVSETVRDLARFAYRSKLAWKLAMMLLATGLKQIKTLTDWQQYGGAPLLGFDRTCIKAHGRSGSRALRNAIKVAARCVRQDLAGSIAASMTELEGRAPSR
ncbi:MAG: phosphate acyltransferase PlsX [Deltaproteobacteria bacterium]|nr:phosphate acyltransferase PlsX [Deltaproteobacteria bacterium]